MNRQSDLVLLLCINIKPDPVVMNSVLSSEFHTLADYLQDSSDKILENWRSSIRQNESQASALNALSQDDFYNSIPDFIHQICRKFRDEESDIEKVSKSHGSHRWQFDFHLRNVVIEWEYLHIILMEQINAAHEQEIISDEILIEAHKQLAIYIHRSIRYSVDEYYRSERDKAEVHMNDLEEALQRNDELTVRRGVNLQEVSHDLGGSMAMLQMNLALLKRIHLNEEASELVEMLIKSAESLNELLTGMLDLFRLEADREGLEITKFDAAELLRDLCDSMESLARKKNLELRSSGDENLFLQSDRVKVKRIAQNLLLNSLKYTEEGFIGISWEKVSENHWHLSVRDSGAGIDSANVAPFLKTSGQEEPSAQKPSPEIKTDQPSEVQLHSEGIGLSIVRRLCDMLDAVVKIETEPGEGTHFQIMLPLDLNKS